MAISESTRTRAPRGTKTLTRAFFAALAEIPEDRRDSVAKAAHSAIREELQARRVKQAGKSGRAAGTARGAAKADGGARKRTPVRRTRRTRETSEENAEF